jgi:hypothetical protein
MHRNTPHRPVCRTELHVFEAMPRGGFGGHTPEDDELVAAVIRLKYSTSSPQRTAQPRQQKPPNTAEP